MAPRTGVLRTGEKKWRNRKERKGRREEGAVCSEDAEGPSMAQFRFSMITTMPLSTHHNPSSCHSAMQFRSQSPFPNAIAISLLRYPFHFRSEFDSYSIASEAFSERISSLSSQFCAL
ncbi:hypothetical protein Ahy_B04g069017 isoform B [Arachis hypogaea]|uniref:Uncharacterized protein n=1 Tax=Arachis hypogaea TaxID=3818 RepID=A0A444ZBM6_ARAHY|nr:hypothetical protein Ahy_B04g069017 isoform B [Arachis hypogaea]